MRTHIANRWLVVTLAVTCGVTQVQVARGDNSSDEQQGAQLEEVVVTAQKRDENLQSVPISVQVISSQILSEQNHNSLEELTQIVPSVHVGPGLVADTLFVRGVGSGGAFGGNPGFDQSVAMFEDDIYHGRSRTSEASFLDLDRIEVLKGPQSTFFGNNAIAGALNVVTKKPGNVFDASVRVLYGMFGQYAAEGAVTLPVNDTLSVRVAGTFNGMNGWAKNVNTGEKEPVVDNKAGRITLVYKPNEDLDATLKIEGGENKTGPEPTFWANCPPPAPLPASWDTACTAALAANVPMGLTNNETAEFPGQGSRLTTFEDVLTINYRKWDHTFTSVTGFNSFDHTNRYATPLPSPFITWEYEERYHQISQEFRVASPTGRPIEYMMGAYYQADHTGWQGVLALPELNYFAGLPGFGVLTPYLPLGLFEGYTQPETVYSVFGSLSWNVTDRLKLNAGVRGSWVKKDFNGSNFDGQGILPYSAAVLPVPPAVEQIWSTNIFASGADHYNRLDHAWMPSAGIQYQIEPGVMAYFSYSNGFKSGGYNGIVPYQPGVPEAFGPEHVNSYELGLKSKWFDNRFLANLDVFREDYSNLQVDATGFNQVTKLYTYFVQNAATSVSQGVELETQWAMTKNFLLGTNVTYLDSHYGSYPNAPQTTLQTFCAGNYVLPYCSQFSQPVPPFANLSGVTTLFAPRWAGSVTATYNMVFPGDYKLTTALMPYFTSSFNNQDPYEVGTSAYIRLDARLTLASPQGRWSADLIGKNLTDRIIVTSYGALDNLTKEQPRNVAVQFRYHF